MNPTEPAADKSDASGAWQRYPFPIASCFRRATDGAQDPTAQFAAIIDTFEILLILLTHIQVAQYLRSGATDTKLNRLLINLFVVKPNISTGDWANLLAHSTRSIRAKLRGDALVPELGGFFQSAGNRMSSDAQALLSLCAMRNSDWGHKLGRTTDFYREAVAKSLPVMRGILDRMPFLSDLLLVVPSRMRDGQVLEGLVYDGCDEPLSRELSIALAGEELSDRATLLRPNRSVLLVRRGRPTHVCLFPFLHSRGSQHRRRGLYLLTSMRWVAKGERYRLQRSTYVADDFSGEPADDPESREALEQVMLPLLGLPGKTGSAVRRMASDALQQADPDYSVPTVWLERDAALRVVVGRDGVLGEAEAHVRDLLPQGGLLMLYGPPGIGKSTLIYTLHSRLTPVQPLLHSVGLGRRPAAFLRALIQQCAVHLGHPLGLAAYVGEDPDALRRSLEHRMQEVVRARGSCVAIIDALDEMPCADGDWERALQWLPRVYSPGVVFVISCRPHHRLLDALRIVPQSRRREIEVRPLARHDMRQCAARLLGANVAAQIESVVDLGTIYTRSDGNPIFLRILLDEAAAELAAAQHEGRPPRRLDFSRIAAGERAIMSLLWERATGKTGGATEPEQARRRRAIQYLCCGDEPGLSLALLRALLERSFEQALDLDDANALLVALSPLLKELSPGRYMPFHLSLREFVRDQKLSSADAARLHGDFAAVLTTHGSEIDHVYWRRRSLDHAAAARLPHSRSWEMFRDRGLLRAALADGQGAMYGAYLRNLFAEHSTAAGADGESCGTEDRKTFAHSFLDAWGFGSTEYAALQVDQQEEIAELLTAADLPGFYRGAEEVYSALYKQTGEASYELKRSWICYQGLDRWREALTALHNCVGRFASAGKELEAALSRRLLAQVAFDTGSEDLDPEALLRDECLPVFSRLGLQKDVAITHEVIGVVVDAEGRWDASLRHYEEATRIHDAMEDTLGWCRVELNRSVARLFTEGPEGAASSMAAISRRIAALSPAAIRAGGAAWAQLHVYLAANHCMLALMAGDEAAWCRAASEVRTVEQWVQMSFRETSAIRLWFGGKPSEAAEQMERLAAEFAEMGDAWGQTDGWINLGLLHAATNRRDLGADLLLRAYRSTCELAYPLGTALAAEGLRRLGVSAPGQDDHIAFFDRHLGRLFDRCLSPFVPCYLLLLP